MSEKEKLKEELDRVECEVRSMEGERDDLKIKIAQVDWPYEKGDRLKHKPTGEERIFDCIRMGRYSAEVYLFNIKKNGEPYITSNWELMANGKDWEKVDG